MHHKPSRDDIITPDNDNRIFAFGSFLRKTNIDEFPQFINIIKGDMSVSDPDLICYLNYQYYLKN